jgi:radical SAM protein with 4Fe4S-binding SPASM domain
MALAAMESAIDRLLAARVANVTLTGGEPLIHPELFGILELLAENDIDVTVCTNGVSVSDDLIDLASDLGRVRFNVSLDGLSAESHGKFRGNRDSFEATLRGTHSLGEAGLLKGILSTPNALAKINEYVELYNLGKELNVDYLLMNPLSSFGRGILSKHRLQADEQTMASIQTQVTIGHKSPGDPDPVFIRFPNQTRPLTNCIAGEILYVFVNGDTTVCPYLVFASRTPNSKHTPEEFMIGNLFDDPEFASKADEYDFHNRYKVGSNPSCTSCSMESSCGKGCPAAVITNGGRIGGLDEEVCPIVGQKRLAKVTVPRTP